MNILVTGSNGYIGSSIKKFFNPTYNITYINRAVLDLQDSVATNNFFIDKSFDVVIHTAVSGGNRLAKEDGNTLDSNLLMYYNLLNNSQHFNKFIHFGSGAEFFKPPTMYGLSKQVIFNSILEKDNFYNIRIYGVFNEDELDRRFIKTCIVNNKTKRNITITKDKLMDFIYMEDLLNLIKYYIANDDMPKSIDCTYKKTYKPATPNRVIRRETAECTKFDEVITINADEQISIKIPKNNKIPKSGIGIILILL